MEHQLYISKFNRFVITQQQNLVGTLAGTCLSFGENVVVSQCLQFRIHRNSSFAPI